MAPALQNLACRGGALGSMPLGSGQLGSRVLGGIFLAEVIDVSTIDVSTTPQLPVILTNPLRWTVVPVGLGAAQTVVAAQELIPETKTRLLLVPGMTFGVQYLIELSSEARLREGCESIVVQAPPVPPAPVPPALLPSEEPYDVANPQLVRDAGLRDPPPLGQYQINDIGDYALDNRLQGLRKRILRRASTALGGFFHLPEFGFASGIKEPIHPSQLVALAANAKIQVEREPEVIRATVSMTQLKGSPHVVVQAISVRTIGGLDLVANQQIDLRPTGLRS